ncbi:hypothetical protein PN499_14510 [Kamptonema animale CS-326]|nr:hypothetical protein [Kamptonema animale]MDB9512400.1 hypothetical protein [Kamptonema animale CS-326]
MKGLQNSYDRAIDKGVKEAIAFVFLSTYHTDFLRLKLYQLPLADVFLL